MIFPVTFLSLGPGNAECLTIQAVKTLKEAAVMFLPATRSAEGYLTSRVVDIAGEWCDKNCIQLFEVPMQTDRKAAIESYDGLCADVISYVSRGQKVVVGVEGDVSIYASVHYVMNRLKDAGIAVQQLAGIPSFIAAAARAGISLVSQHQQLIIMPGDATVETLESMMDDRHTIVIMKLSRCQDALRTFLMRHPAVECHYFENVGCPDEFYTTDINALFHRTFPYFSLCVIRL